MRRKINVEEEDYWALGTVEGSFLFGPRDRVFVKELDFLNCNESVEEFLSGNGINDELELLFCRPLFILFFKRF